MQKIQAFLECSIKSHLSMITGFCFHTPKGITWSLNISDGYVHNLPQNGENNSRKIPELHEDMKRAGLSRQNLIFRNNIQILE